MDTKHFRNISGKFATGITIITTKDGEDTHGMTANGFMSVSLEPALILVSIGKQQKLHDLLLKSGRFGVSILNDKQENISNHFAGKFDKDLDLSFEEKGGTPLIPDALGYFVANVVSTHEEGDHTLFIGEVEVCGAGNHDANPLLFYSGQYRLL